jgi:alanine dehydrogenase
MIIGIPKETKPGEVRVALTPAHAGRLAQAGHRVRIERGAGAGCRFSDDEYAQAGAEIAHSVLDSDMIVRVKAPPADSIRKFQIIMGYLHVEKGQNPRLLNALLDTHATSYAYEEIRDRDGERLVNLGYEAGIVGMYEGLRIYGQVLERHGLENRFRALKPVREFFFSEEEILDFVDHSGLADGVTAYILGKGRVSRGAQQVLKHTPIKPKVLYRKQTANMSRYLSWADIIVNAVDWYPGEPTIITKDMLRKMKRTAVIVDISCDTNGSIESCIATSWDDPTYTFNGITHFCVDNLPSAIPRDSSVHLSEMIIEHVLTVASGEDLPTGLMTRDGVFEHAVMTGAAAAVPRAAPTIRVRP